MILRKKFRGFTVNFSVTKNPEVEKDLDRRSSSNDPNKKVIKMRAANTIMISLLLLPLNVLAYLFLEGIWGDHPVRITIVETVYSLANSIIGVVFGLGISTLALDFFSYIKYAQERIKEVMLEKRYLDTLSDREKRRIIDSLESSLYFKSKPIPEDSLYVNIKSKIIPFLGENYLENYYLHIDCHFEENCIKKFMRHDLVIFSTRDNVDYALPFSVYMDRVEKSEYRVTALKFNDEPVELHDPSDHMETSSSKDERNKEVTRYHLSYSFNLKKGINKISYNSESVVDISDMSYSHNLVMPCKHYLAEIVIRNPEYDVRGCGFAIDKKESLDIKYFDNICRIEFKDWTIPGDGIIFVFNKKSPSFPDISEENPAVST